MYCVAFHENGVARVVMTTDPMSISDDITLEMMVQVELTGFNHTIDNNVLVLKEGTWPMFLKESS